jgi:ssDNA-binding Zn-finger/Zn-ribbon topoisomerase 1
MNVTKTCKKCGKQFLIIEKEQQFLNEKGIELPTDCPACRQTRRLKLRGERTLFKTTCNKCGKVIIVTFDPITVTNQILCRQDYDKYLLENDPIITDPLPEN